MVRERNEYESVRLLIDKFIGKKVLKVNAGGSTGSVFSLDIGDELISKEKNGHTFLQGEFFLMVNCAWRLDDLDSNRPVTGWHENSDVGGVMTLRLKSLFNDEIEKIVLSSFYDLEIIFKSRKRLFVFCDLTPYVDEESNWFFKSDGKYYSVTNNLVCLED